MSSPPTDATGPGEDARVRAAALEKLRAGVNPFATQVAAVGTAEESLLGDVPEFAESQLADLHAIIDTYRGGKATTRAFAVLGDRGAGKTHLFYSLRNQLKQRTGERGEETLLVVVERLAPGMDAIDYLLWQIANHFLAHKGEGGRMLGVIAGRLTARLLGESLRQLGPHQKAELVPSTGFWAKIGFGSSKAQAKIDAVDGIIQYCDAKHPTPTQIKAAVAEAGVKPEAVVGIIERHLERTESNDVVGWLRKELYRRLARVALLDEREEFDELHMGGFDDARANVKNAGNLGRRLLETWLELLALLNIPVVVAFDQLEDYVNAPDAEQEKVNRKFFTDSTSKFINELKNICLLIFANETFWIGLINNAEPFARERLTQPFTLPGRPARSELRMPNKLPAELVERLVQQRLRVQFPDLDLTGLLPSFPFDGEDVKKVTTQTSIRTVLRALARRYDEILHKPVVAKQAFGDPLVPPPPPPPAVAPPPAAQALKQRLDATWKEQLKKAKRRFETEISVGTAFIPEVQNALDGWLQCLFQHQVTGAGAWQRVELATDTKLGAYGYLSVIRTEGRNSPGVGIAAWLGQSRGQANDLKQRAKFFRANPCPIRTLVLLREDVEGTLRGPQTREAFETAAEKHDVRVQEFGPKHLHALLAFGPWQQAAVEELKAAKETDSGAEKAFKEYLGELSAELLGWVDAWRKPKPVAAMKGANA